MTRKQVLFKHGWRKIRFSTLSDILHSSNLTLRMGEIIIHAQLVKTSCVNLLFDRFSLN